MPYNDDTDSQKDTNKNDLLSELLADEEKAIGQDNVDVSALQKELEELRQANAGLLKAKQAEVKKRQEASDRLNKVEGAVSAILSQRQQAGLESVTEKQADDARKMGIPVTYDDDGNGWIDPSDINGLLSPYMQHIQQLEAALQNVNEQSYYRSEADKIKEAVIGEDERFSAAAGRYRAARRWVEDQVAQYARSHGVNRSIGSGEALRHIFDEELRDEFKNQFKDLDLFHIVTAEDSDEHFRRTLAHIADASAPASDLNTPKDKMDSRFQKVLNKPSNLGNQANAKAGQISLLDRLETLKPQDIMELPDSAIETLMKLAEKEGI